MESTDIVQKQENDLKFTIEKKKLIDKITSKLNKNDFIHILKILIDANIPYSENKNGVFIDLSLLNKDVFEEISDFVDLCMEYKEHDISNELLYPYAKDRIDKLFEEENKIEENKTEENKGDN